jgi:hypothetical protein
MSLSGFDHLINKFGHAKNSLDKGLMRGLAWKTRETSRL